MDNILENFDKLHNLGIPVIYGGVSYVKRNGTWFAQSPVGDTEEIVIPTGVTHIDDNAFRGSHITTVTLPDTLRSIGNCAFQETSIYKITFPKSLKIVGFNAFKGCMNLAEVDISQTRGLIIFPNAFRRTDVRSLSCRRSFICERAFADCDKLKEVILIDCTLVNGNGGCFSNCKSLETAKLIDEDVHNGDTHWDDSKRMFEGCRSLVNVQLPDTMKKMQYHMFNDCVSLKSITIPRNIELIEKEVLLGCESIENIDFSHCDPLGLLDLGCSDKILRAFKQRYLHQQGVS